MTPAFRDAEHQRRFDRDGFVVIPLLPPEEAATVRRRAESLYHARDVAADAASPKRDYHVSLLHPDAPYRRSAFELVRETLCERIEAVVPDYRLLTGSLLIKPPGAQPVAVHRDWSMTAEPTDTNLNCWCALEPVDAANGAMGLVPGSHRILSDNAEGPGIPSCFSEYERWLRRPSQLVPLAAGEAVIFDYRLLHWSCSNRSGRARFAVSAGCIPATARPALHVGGADARSLYRIEAAREKWIDMMIEAARGLDVTGAPAVANRNRVIALSEAECLLGLERAKPSRLTRVASFAERVARGVARRVVRR